MGHMCQIIPIYWKKLTKNEHDSKKTYARRKNGLLIVNA